MDDKNSVETLLRGHLLNGHLYRAAIDQSPDESFSFVCTSIKRPLSTSPEVGL